MADLTCGTLSWACTMQLIILIFVQDGASLPGTHDPSEVRAFTA